MYEFIKFILRVFFRIAFSVKVEGRENIPKDTPVLYVCNHRSNIDPPLVGSFARGSLALMAKEELFRNKFFGWLITKLGAFPVSRGKGDTAVIDTAVERLQERSLFMFPEGTRSKDGKVHKGHTGAALVAAKSGRQVLPCGIIFGPKLKFRSKIRVIYGKPIDTAEYVESSENPNPRQLVKLKNRYMDDIKGLVEEETMKLFEGWEPAKIEMKEEKSDE